MSRTTRYDVYKPDRVFSMMQIGLGTLFGGPIGGFAMMALNYHTFGSTGKILPAILCGLGLTLIMVLIASIIPDGISILPIIIFGMFLTMSLARKWQESMISATLKQPDDRHSGHLAICAILFGINATFMIWFGVDALL